MLINDWNDRLPERGRRPYVDARAGGMPRGKGCSGTLYMQLASDPESKRAPTGAQLTVNKGVIEWGGVETTLSKAASWARCAS